MKILKRINNNTVICVNAKGRELVALGRGIGFPNSPDELTLDRVERTFYGVDARYLALLDEIDPQVMEFSAQIADIARSNISRELSPNLPFTMADHVAFAIKRCREHMFVQMPLSYDVQQMYPIEYKIAKFALEGINRGFNIKMPPGEASGIALCIVNSVVASSSKAKSNTVRKDDAMLEKFTKIIESELGVCVDRDGFDFCRYATHVRYLLERVQTGEPLNTDNGALYGPLCEQHPDVAVCVDRMAALIAERFGAALADEEKVYLMLHVNRVCAGSRP